MRSEEVTTVGRKQLVEIDVVITLQKLELMYSSFL